MGELGSRLREAREALGLSLQEAEEATRIRRALLQALEEERYGELPGDVYVRGFIRNYARYLGLDEGALLREFRAQRGQTLRQREPLAYGEPPFVLDEPLTRRSAFSRLLNGLLWFVVVIGLVAGAWYAYSRFYLGGDPWAPLHEGRERVVETWAAIRSERTPVVDDERDETLERPTPTAEDEAPLEEVEPAPEATPTEVLETPTPTATPTPRPTPTPEPISGVLVEARVTAATWLAVTVDGETVFEGTLSPGDDPTWQAEREVIMRVGNAGGLSLVVNGRDVGALGDPGQVLTVTYTADEEAP